jgi:hypothetical protein
MSGATMAVDYHAKFCETVYHLIGEECARRGWDAITEDELEYLVRDLLKDYYYQTIAQFHVATGQRRTASDVRVIPLVKRLGAHDYRT